MEESNLTLEAEKAKLKERIRQLEAKIQDLNLGLHHTQTALDGQREKLYELERNGTSASLRFAWESSVSGAQQKISSYEEDMNSLESRLQENNRELNSCKERLKNIEALIADSTV